MAALLPLKNRPLRRAPQSVERIGTAHALVFLRRGGPRGVKTVAVDASRSVVEVVARVVATGDIYRGGTAAQKEVRDDGRGIRHYV